MQHRVRGDDDDAAVEHGTEHAQHRARGDDDDAAAEHAQHRARGDDDDAAAEEGRSTRSIGRGATMTTTRRRRGRS